MQTSISASAHCREYVRAQIANELSAVKNVILHDIVRQEGYVPAQVDIVVILSIAALCAKETLDCYADTVATTAAGPGIADAATASLRA